MRYYVVLQRYCRQRLLLTLNVGNHIALLNLCTLLGVDFYKLAAEGCLNLYKLAPRCLNPAESVAFLVLLTDERLYSGSTFALTIELPEHLSLNRSDNSVGLSMLECADLLG